MGVSYMVQCEGFWPYNRLVTIAHSGDGRDFAVGRAGVTIASSSASTNSRELPMGVLMPKLTAKQEGFAQAIALANPPMSLADAYRANYDAQGMQVSTLHQCASRLASDPKITARVQALEGESLAIAQLSHGRIAHELAENRTLALADGAFAAANKATELRGDMLDSFHRRKRTVKVSASPNGEFADMPLDALVGIVEASYKELDGEG
jgi:hypothetical protein